MNTNFDRSHLFFFFSLSLSQIRGLLAAFLLDGLHRHDLSPLLSELLASRFLLPAADTPSVAKKAGARKTAVSSECERVETRTLHASLLSAAIQQERAEFAERAACGLSESECLRMCGGLVQTQRVHPAVQWIEAALRNDETRSSSHAGAGVREVDTNSDALPERLDFEWGVDQSAQEPAPDQLDFEWGVETEAESTSTPGVATSAATSASSSTAVSSATASSQKRPRDAVYNWNQSSETRYRNLHQLRLVLLCFFVSIIIIVASVQSFVRRLVASISLGFMWSCVCHIFAPLSTRCP